MVKRFTYEKGEHDRPIIVDNECDDDYYFLDNEEEVTRLCEDLSNEIGDLEHYHNEVLKSYIAISKKYANLELKISQILNKYYNKKEKWSRGTEEWEEADKSVRHDGSFTYGIEFIIKLLAKEFNVWLRHDEITCHNCKHHIGFCEKKHEHHNAKKCIDYIAEY